VNSTSRHSHQANVVSDVDGMKKYQWYEKDTQGMK
jgi:hypothetical protein